MPMIGPLEEGTTCACHGKRHTWESVPIVTPKNFDPNNPGQPPAPSLVCMECGVISGSEDQFTPDGLALLKQKIQAMNEQKAFAEEIQQFRKKELERKFYNFMENTLVPKDEEARKNGFYKKIYDLGIESVEAVEKEIGQKIQQKQQEQFLKMVSKANENNSNV